MAVTISDRDAAPEQDPGAASAHTPPLTLTDARLDTVVSAAWELELVIAGGVTFALFQLPGSLENARSWLNTRATSIPAVVVEMAFVYIKITVYVLLGAFLLNLTARAYWVGLVGLHSVFPRGIDWEKQRMGPASRDVYRERLPSLPAVIGRVDNFASIIFSFAFLIVIVVIFSLASVGVFGGVAWGVNAVFFGGRSVVSFPMVAVVLALPLATLGIVDKTLGPRWPADSVAGRRLRRLVRVVSTMNGASIFGPILLTLFTNLRRGVMSALFYATFFAACALGVAELFLRLGIVAAGSPRYVPDNAEVRGVVADYYESLRGADSPPAVPTIQSDLVDGPYIRLFIPYIVPRHDPALARGCAGARPLRTTRIHLRARTDDLTAAGLSADTVLQCLVRMHAITLDGVARPDVPLRFYTHPGTGQRGMLAYIPTAPLAAGAHMLTVMPPPRTPTSSNPNPLTPYLIPFQR